MAEARHYARPPIVEAVIEVRFEGALTSRELERVRDRFKPSYSTIEQLNKLEVQVGPGKPVKPVVSITGFKMTHRDALDVVILQTSGVATVRRAPYESWERLRAKASENWELLEKVLKTRKRVIRLGARFVNRIDIPDDMLKEKGISGLFNAKITLPADLGGEPERYNFAIYTRHAKTGANLLIQSSIQQKPAILDHTSITLDTDSSWDKDIPQRIDEMWAKADMLREVKNDVFESTITDDLRALFQ